MQWNDARRDSVSRSKPWSLSFAFVQYVKTQCMPVERYLMVLDGLSFLKEKRYSRFSEPQSGHSAKALALWFWPAPLCWRDAESKPVSWNRGSQFELMQSSMSTGCASLQIYCTHVRTHICLACHTHTAQVPRTNNVHVWSCTWCMYGLGDILGKQVHWCVHLRVCTSVVCFNHVLYHPPFTTPHAPDVADR